MREREKKIQRENKRDDPGSCTLYEQETDSIDDRIILLQKS